MTVWEGVADVRFHQGRLWPYPSDLCTQCGQHRGEHDWDVGPDLFPWPVCPPCEECGTYHLGPDCADYEDDA